MARSGGRVGVWDGNVLKLGCDDGCTAINIIKFTKLLKKKTTMYTHVLHDVI